MRLKPVVNASAKVAVPKTGDDSVAIVAQLRDIHARLVKGSALTAGQSRLLTNAIGAYLEGLDGDVSPSLDRSIGLRTRGGVSPSRRDALETRDRSILRLWRIVPEWTDVHPVAVSRLMRQSADKYIRSRWLRDRDAITAPSSEPAATWWKILQSNLSIPGQRQLRNILNDAKG